MAIDSVPNFVDALRQHRLLESQQLDEVARVQGKAADPRVLAKALIQKGWLSPYQVNQLLQGKGADLVLGQYRILERLGEGGMGQVFKARHAAMGRIVALKVIRKERLDNAEAVKRFHREIQAAAKLAHPNIVLSFDADAAGNTHYLAMEYVEGIDLSRLTREEGPLPVHLACEYIRQAAVGLQYAHERGMVHRDIKPANLLLERSAETNGKAANSSTSSAHLKKRGKPVVKILDMGLARLQPHEHEESMTALSVDGSVMGTPDFMAPEQAKNSHKVDHRADIYSLGCAFYFLLTKQPPFPGGNHLEKLLKHQMDPPPPLSDHRPDVPPLVQQIMDRMLAKRPEDRFQNCSDLAAALDPCTEPGASGASPSGLRPLPSGAATVAVGSPTLITPVSSATAVVAPVTAPLRVAPSLERELPFRRRRALPARGKVLVYSGLALFVLMGSLFILWAATSSGKPSTGGVASTGPATRDTRPNPGWKPGEAPGLARLVPDNISLAVLINSETFESKIVHRIAGRRDAVAHFRDERLKDLGFDVELLHELGLERKNNAIQRVVLTTTGGGRKFDFFLIQGTFEADAARDILRKQSAAVHPIEGLGPDGKYYEVVDTANGLGKFYAAVPGPGVVVHSPNKADVISVMEKVASPNKAGLKDKDLQRLLEKPDPRANIEAFMGGSMTFDPNGLSILDNTALGIRGVHGTVALNDGADLKAVVTCTSEERVPEFKRFFFGSLLPLASLDRKNEALVAILNQAKSTQDRQTLIIERQLNPTDIFRLFPKPPG